MKSLSLYNHRACASNVYSAVSSIITTSVRSYVSTNVLPFGGDPYRLLLLRCMSESFMNAIFSSPDFSTLLGAIRFSNSGS